MGCARLGRRPGDKQITQTLIKQQFRGHPAVRAGQNGGRRTLTLGASLPPVDILVGMLATALHEPPIAFP